MPLINCKVNLILTFWHNSTGARRFAIRDTKLYVPVVILSAQYNAKLLHHLKSGFKRTINWNKYQSDPKTYEKKQTNNI